MTARDVGMRTEPDLERVLPVVCEDRVARIGALPARRVDGERGRQLERLQRRFQLWIEEVRERDSLVPCGRAHYPVHGRGEVTAGEELHHLAEVHDERVWHFGDV